MHQVATLEDTLYFYFAANSAGSGADGAGAAFDVREGGAAAGAAPIVSGNATLLSHANYPDGCYEIAVSASVGSGFTAGRTYAVFSTLAVGGTNPTGIVGSFRLSPVPATVSGMATAGVQNAMGANLAHLLASLVGQLGPAIGGTSSTLQLSEGASSEDGAYVGLTLVHRGQARLITAYDGASRTATVHAEWVGEPDTSTYYVTSLGGWLDMRQVVPQTNLAGTIGDALCAARAEAFGDRLLDVPSKQMRIKGIDGETDVHVFEVDNVTTPTRRTSV